MPCKSLTSFLPNYPGDRSSLIPLLQKAQEIYGFLPQEAVHDISLHVKVSENEIFGVATFYSQFRFCPPGKHHLRVCLGTACHVKGGEQILETVKRKLEVEPGQTTADGEYDLERVACLGCCALAPVFTLDAKMYSQMSVLKLQRILNEHETA
ncbi:MAG: NADH-quinone oxidoreductase subunit NuoE [Candidatus Brocadiia bacterium]